VTAFSEGKDISAKDLLLKKVSLDDAERSAHHQAWSVPPGRQRAHGVRRLNSKSCRPLGARSRRGFEIFQNLSARDVCDKLLAGTPHDWKLTRTLSPRLYCFRYRESRWNCVARLLEQEGIFFRYDHKSGEAMLVLGDSTASAQPAWGVTELVYNEHELNLPTLTRLRVESRPYVAQTRVRTASEFLYMKNVGDVTAASATRRRPT
jgi:type VI secretion system secreted protein VgrG